jgi:AraC-like DNA-binding protein
MERRSPATNLVAPGTARISMIFVRALCEAVGAAGSSVELLARKAGVSPEQFAKPYGWIELEELDRLLGHAIEITNDPAFGLHWAASSPMMKFDVLAMAIAYAPSLRDCLACLCRFQPILFQHPEVDVVERADAVLLRVVPRATSELALRVRAELSVASLLRLLRHVGVPESAVQHVAFSHAAPPYAEEYARLFAGRAHFAQEAAGIAVDPRWLDRSLQHTNLELYDLLTNQAQEVLVRAQGPLGYAQQVRERLRQLFPRDPGARELARALGLSERSLRRRLAEEGESYSSILQETRKLLARQLVADPARSIREIGRDVGFKSGPAFQRAFKRWTGETPGVFRVAKAPP